MEYPSRDPDNHLLFTKLIAVLLFSLLAVGSRAENPLEALDTSSPQATFESFLVNIDDVVRRYFEYRDAPSRATYDKFFRAQAKGSRLLDLSQVPPAARYEVAAETRRLLREVIARVELPELGEIPDASALKATEEDGEPLKRWRLPGTEITITRVEEGPRTGEYLFSADTVERARSFYEAARDLPYQRTVPTGNLIRTAELFTGWMIPPTWVEALPAWANSPVLGQVLWKWFAVLLLFGVAAIIVLTLFLWGQHKPWNGSLRSYLRRLSTPMAILGLVPLVQHFARVQISITGPAAQAPDYLLTIGRGIAIVWSLWLTMSWIAEAIIALPGIASKSLDAHLIRLAARSVGILAILVLLFGFANDIGIPVYGLIAGAGVGGLAIALAARTTLEDFLGPSSSMLIVQFGSVICAALMRNPILNGVRSVGWSRSGCVPPRSVVSTAA